jgi:hypothetical protein
MERSADGFMGFWGRGLLVSMAGYVAVSLLVVAIDEHVIHKNELFFSWLLVFFNASIGTFIANRAVKSDSTGFWVWAFLVNGFRAGVFLILLLAIVKWKVTNVSGFVLLTLFGYFAFLAAEIYGLQVHTKRTEQDPRCGLKDD